MSVVILAEVKRGDMVHHQGTWRVARRVALYPLPLPSDVEIKIGDEWAWVPADEIDGHERRSATYRPCGHYWSDAYPCCVTP